MADHSGTELPDGQGVSAAQWRGSARSLAGHQVVTPP
jgi:hypothetical protein